MATHASLGYTETMFLRISKRLLKLALFAPLVMAPLFIGESFIFPVSSFFPFIALKAIFFRVVIEGALFFLILHVLLSSTRKEQLAVLMRKLKHPLALAVIAFGLITFITALLGENPVQSVWSNFERGEGAFQILHYCLFFLLTFVLFVDKEEIKRLIRLNVIISFFVSLYALTQLLNLQTIFKTVGSSIRVSGTLGNPSYLAAYLLINFTLIAYLYLQTSSKKVKLWLSALSLFELIIFINTGTRSAYLGLAIGLMVIYGVMLFTTKDAKLKSRLLMIIIALCAFGIAGIGAYNTIPKLHDSFLLGRLLDVKGAASGFNPRIWTWGSALHGVAEKPILGWGVENFAYPFDKYYNPNHYGIESFFDRTHNIFLEYLISGGIVLLLAYLSIWFFYYRNLRGHQKNLWYAIIVAAPIMYIVQGFFLFDVLATYLIMFLFLALVTNIAAAPENTSLSDDGYDLGHTELLLATGLFALLTYIVIVTSIIPWKKNLKITAAYDTPRNDAQASFNAFQEAIVYPSLVGQEEAVSGLMKFSIDLLDAAAKQSAAVPTEIIRGIVDTNNHWFDTYRNQFTGARDTYLNGGLNLRAGLSFGFPDYAARGKATYNEVLSYAPNRIEFLQILLETARATGDTKEFESVLARLKELRPDIAWNEVITPAAAAKKN